MNQSSFSQYDNLLDILNMVVEKNRHPFFQKKEIFYFFIYDDDYDDYNGCL